VGGWPIWLREEEVSMSCPIERRERSELAAALVSGKLEGWPAGEFGNHVRGCADCRKAVEEQRALWRSLDEWSAPPVSGDFNRRLYARIENEGSWWEVALRRVWGLAGKRGLPVAATAGVVLLAGLLLRQPGAPPMASNPESAEVVAVGAEQAESALADMEMMREFSSLMRSANSQPRM
jgi:hypothetical protein